MRLGFLGAALSAFGALGCTVRRRPTPPPPPAVAARPAPAASSAAAPAAPPLDPPEGPVADPEAARSFLASLDQPGLPLLTTAKPPRVTLMGLENTARGEAGGMTPEDTIYSGLLALGQRATAPVSLPARGCFTFIGQGGLGIIELDLFLTVGSGPDAKIVGEDPTSGPIAVIGGKQGCFKTTDGPVKGELHARARRGAGAVIVRVYRR